MQTLNNSQLTIEDKEELINYVNNKNNDLATQINSILEKVLNNEQLLNSIAEDITNISNSIPADIADILNNYGSYIDFENGIIKGIYSIEVDYTTASQLEILGHITGTHIKNHISEKNLVKIFVDYENGNDGNDGLSQDTALKTITQALNYATKFYLSYITLNGNQALQDPIYDIILIENIHNMKIVSINNNSIFFKKDELNTFKGKFYIKDCYNIKFDNITFINSEPLDFTNLIDFKNSAFYIENSNIEFSNCIFDYTSQNNIDNIQIIAKNSKILFDNCVFNTNVNVIVVNALNDIPNLIIENNCIYNGNISFKNPNNKYVQYG